MSPTSCLTAPPRNCRESIPFHQRFVKHRGSRKRAKTLIYKFEDDLARAYQPEFLTGDFLDIPKITAQTLHLTDQGGIFLLDNLNLTHQTPKIVLCTPHGQQATIT